MSDDAGDATAGAPSPQQRASGLRIGWIMPPFLHELPVNAVDDEAAADQLYTLVTELLPDHPPEYQYRFALASRHSWNPWWRRMSSMPASARSKWRVGRVCRPSW